MLKSESRSNLKEEEGKQASKSYPVFGPFFKALSNDARVELISYLKHYDDFNTAWSQLIDKKENPAD